MLARTLLPRLVLSALFLAGAFFAFFESVYLREQAKEFAHANIRKWAWLVRGLAAVNSIAAVAIILVR